MKNKNILIFIYIYLLLAISIGVCFNPAFMKELPQMEVYKGNMEFSGEKAYSNLKLLTENYSRRVLGTDMDRNSAEWMKNNFTSLGLKAYIQEFDWGVNKSREFGFETDEKINPADLMLRSLSEVYAQRKGYNVIGVSEGKSNEVIVIGAHRDMVGSIQGAEDNGSGTATMLELARALTTKEHYFTYAFVSFDGEEAGLKGSEYFVGNNKSLKIKAVVVMDMVGFKDANALSFYQYFTARGATQLWTMALSHNVLKSMSLQEYEFKTQDKMENPTVLFLKMLAQRSFGVVNTDSGAFIDESIPSIGLKSIQLRPNTRGYQTGMIHQPADTIDQVSADSLEVSGRFVEKFVQSIDRSGYQGNMKSSMFLIYGSKFLPPAFVYGALAVILLIVLLVLAIQIINVFKNMESFLNFIKYEKKWLLAILAYSVFVSGFWQLFRFDFMQKAPILITMILYLLITLAAIILILVMRFRSLKRLKAEYHEVTAFQRNLINIVFVGLFLFIAVLVSPFTAICLTLTPVLVLGRVSYRNEGLRILWILVFVLWSVFQFGITLACIQSYIFDLTSVKLAVLLFSCIALWATSFIYMISTPPMSKRILKKVENIDTTAQ